MQPPVPDLKALSLTEIRALDVKALIQFLDEFQVPLESVPLNGKSRNVPLRKDLVDAAIRAKKGLPPAEPAAPGSSPAVTPAKTPAKAQPAPVPAPAVASAGVSGIQAAEAV
eukprot:CAMPEP_0174906776 /NCGR_PEP_ID=MMETSP0167-20121228/58338_1 /TAXON_ID=38298 /ORGANISM="Rhodella maculata, Strain CCMP736" /LENGTH=111 /DNA_ID=CAMNT_0016150089 /DNA_START=130 /DNA_END=462 /DNA_ORIENTATION=-